MRYALVTKEELIALPHNGNQWYVPNLLPESGTTIVYGVPGEGKSTICMEWALALQNGIPFAGSDHFAGEYVGNPINTAWLSFEDDWSWEVRSRLVQHGDDLEWPLFIAEPTGGTWTDALSLILGNGSNPDSTIGREVKNHWDDLCSQLQESGVRVLFIDTISELLDSDASPRLVQETFRHFGDMRRKYGVTTVLIGHASSHKGPNGKKKDELLGATAWVAKARHTVLVDGNTKATWARVMKSNRGPTGYNVTMKKVDGGPVHVVDVNTANEYVERAARKRQDRDWIQLRTYAQQAWEAGSGAWANQTSLGQAVGMSKSVGFRMCKAGFFREGPNGGWEPVLELINGTQSKSDAA
jgi:hypothetical protein